MTNSVWSEIKLQVPTELGELAAEIFQEQGAGGVVFDDPEILVERQLKDDECLGTEVTEQLPERFGLKVYYPVDDRLGERLVLLKKRLAGLLGYEPVLELRQVKEEDWAESWKAYFKPERIGRVVIKPSWEDYSPAEDVTVVELDPGMAFGTGTHPTTRLCTNLLQAYVQANNPARKSSMLDIGTGSGILAITAAKLGFEKVMATDIDPLAVRVAAENCMRNRVGDRVSIVEGDLLKLELNSRFQLVVANIITNAILQIIPELTKVLEPGGYFLASGIIEERSGEVQEALLKQGFLITEILKEEDWSAFLAQQTI